VYKQVVVDGRKKYATRNKKVFFLKQQMNREHKSIRIFVLIGNNMSIEMVNIGIAVTATAIYLESLGYAVRVTGVIGISIEGEATNNHTGKQNIDAYRFNLFDLKKYSDTLDIRTLLYVTSDKSCFRVKFFRYLIAERFDFQDKYNKGLGYVPSIREMRDVLISMMKKREVDVEADTLYYFMGGSDIVTIDDAKQQIEDIIIASEEENYRAMSGN
jgi:hypothetical protein